MSGRVGEEELKCSRCGGDEVVAKIDGEYFCYHCGSRIVMKHARSQLEKLKRRGFIDIEI